MAYITQQKYYENDGVAPTDKNWGPISTLAYRTLSTTSC